MPTKAEYAKNPEHYRAYNRNYLRKWRGGKGMPKAELNLTDEERKLRKSARNKVNWQRYRGKIKAQTCEVQNCEELGHAHHDDYAKPFDVRWLCRKHHEAVHHG